MENDEKELETTVAEIPSVDEVSDGDETENSDPGTHGQWNYGVNDNSGEGGASAHGADVSDGDVNGDVDATYYGEWDGAIADPELPTTNHPVSEQPAVQEPRAEDRVVYVIRETVASVAEAGAARPEKPEVSESEVDEVAATLAVQNETVASRRETREDYVEVLVANTGLTEIGAMNVANKAQTMAHFATAVTLAVLFVAIVMRAIVSRVATSRAAASRAVALHAARSRATTSLTAFSRKKK